MRVLLIPLAFTLAACSSTSSLHSTRIPRSEIARIEADPSRMRVVNSVIHHAERNNVPVNLALAITHAESRMRVNAVGPRTPYGRAYGPLQVLASTARTVEPNATPALLRTYDGGPRIGIAYLARGFREQNGDACRTAMRYHGGPNTRLWGPKTRQYCRIVTGAL